MDRARKSPRDKQDVGSALSGPVKCAVRQVLLLECADCKLHLRYSLVCHFHLGPVPGPVQEGRHAPQSSSGFTTNRIHSFRLLPQKSSTSGNCLIGHLVFDKYISSPWSFLSPVSSEVQNSITRMPSSMNDDAIQKSVICEIIQESGVALGLPQVVMATAQVYFHKFYSVSSMREYSHVWIGAASLFLASKIEEEPLRCRHLATVFHNRLARRIHLQNSKQIINTQNLDKMVLPSHNFVLDYYGSAGYEWKIEIIKAERYILKELGFFLYVDHPHKFILVYCNTMKARSEQEHSSLWDEILQCSWNYANDSLRTDLCLTLKSEAVACGCIHLSCNKLKVKLPTECSKAWWTVFDVDQRQIDIFSQKMKQLYECTLFVNSFVDLTNHNLEAVFMKHVLKK